MAMTSEQTLTLVGHLAWPFVAIIALFALRPMLKELAKLAGVLKWLADNPDKISDLTAALMNTKRC